jgi:hypothetical protein
MIKTYTWISNSELQSRFDSARLQIAASDHPLAINYKDRFNESEIVAYSISCTDDTVYLCGSIARKPYWPAGVYRVLNRLFKPTPKDVFTKRIESFWVDMALQQVEFCKTLPDFRSAIISRKLGYKKALGRLKLYINERGVDCDVWDSDIWVCNDYNNPECQQNILSFGEHVEHEFIR